MAKKETLAMENEDGTVTPLDDIPCEDGPCFNCGKAPGPGDSRWYVLTERDGKTVGVYTCDTCMEASAKPVQ